MSSPARKRTRGNKETPSSLPEKKSETPNIRTSEMGKKQEKLPKPKKQKRESEEPLSPMKVFPQPPKKAGSVSNKPEKEEEFLILDSNKKSVQSREDRAVVRPF
jgi:hypothetical protein